MIYTTREEILKNVDRQYLVFDEFKMEDRSYDRRTISPYQVIFDMSSDNIYLVSLTHSDKPITSGTSIFDKNHFSLKEMKDGSFHFTGWSASLSDIRFFRILTHMFVKKLLYMELKSLRITKQKSTNGDRNKYYIQFSDDADYVRFKLYYGHVIE